MAPEGVTPEASEGGSAEAAPLVTKTPRDGSPPPRAPPDRRPGRLRDTAVLLVGILAALNLLSYKLFETIWSAHFAMYNSVFLSLLTAFLLVGMLLFLPGIGRTARHRPRKLAMFAAGAVLAFSSGGVLLLTRQAGALGLGMGVTALVSLLLLTWGQFEVGWKTAVGTLLLVIGVALVTLVPVHEAFGVYPLGSLWAGPNLVLFTAGALLCAVGTALLLRLADTGGRSTGYFGLWLAGLMALFLVPFHEAAGIQSNAVYGIVDQTLVVTGALLLMAGMLLFLKKHQDDRRFEHRLREGDRSYVAGDHRKALEVYDAALELDPDLQEAWVHRGYALERLGRFDHAAGSFEKALELDPESHAALAGLSSVLRTMGKPRQALKHAARAVELRPDYEIGWVNRATALADLHREEEALQALDRALGMNPDYDKAWMNKGLLLLRLGRPREALECFDEVLNIAPHDQRALRARENCFRALGKARAEG